MNSKEYGEGKRAPRGPKRYDEKRPSDKGNAGKRFDSGRSAKSADTRMNERSTDKSMSGKRTDTGRTGGRFDSDKPARRFDSDKPARRFDSDKPAIRSDTGISGKRFVTGRTGKSADTGTVGKRDERPVKRWSDKPSYGDKEIRSAGGERRYKDTGRTPAPRFTAKRKSSFPEETNAARPVERDVNPEVEEREDRIEGRNPVLEALKSDRPINKVFIEKDNPDATLLKIAAMARDKGIPIQYVDRRKLDTISTTRIHQGVILEAAVHEYAEVADILQIAAEKNEDPFIVVLDGITDINNFGSIIRSAECAGAHGIIIPKRRSATLNATVAKVAAGAQEYVAIARVANLTQAIRELKEKGIWITAADLDGERSYYESDLKGPVALVIGSEGEGISRVVKEECDYLVKIPMKGKISSLNAGVAAGLIMFEISKRRG